MAQTQIATKKLNLLKRLNVFYEKRFKPTFFVSHFQGILIGNVNPNDSIALNDYKLPLLVGELWQFPVIGFDFFFQRHSVSVIKIVSSVRTVHPTKTKSTALI